MKKFLVGLMVAVIAVTVFGADNFVQSAGNLLWTVENPGGYRTAHQPFPLDIDGDGREEIMAGYALLDPDGHNVEAVCYE